MPTLVFLLFLLKVKRQHHHACAGRRFCKGVLQEIHVDKVAAIFHQHIWQAEAELQFGDKFEVRRWNR